jgi:hypothetical protein
MIFSGMFITKYHPNDAIIKYLAKVISFQSNKFPTFRDRIKS